MGTIVFDISMSLDGFISGANPRLEAGLGDDGERLHDWGFNSSDPYNLKLVEEWINTGAIISGRTTYDHSIKHWGDGGPIPSARVPVPRPKPCPTPGYLRYSTSVPDPRSAAIRRSMAEGGAIPSFSPATANVEGSSWE